MMNKTESVAEAARPIFDAIRSKLEVLYVNQFVAIEPVSGEYFLGDTLSDAIGASRDKYPQRLVHTFRIGHRAAIHFGMQTK
ncbi:MAG: hypothetical protein WCH39_11625 [Schlesneria sp.]